MNILYARGSNGVQFNEIADKALMYSYDKGVDVRESTLNGNLVRLDHIKPPLDIYHCHSAHSLYGIRKAKELGAITILQRDSCHILDMIEWCEQGNKIWKDKYPEMCSDLRARTNLEFQLAEYDEADYILVASKLEEQSFINRGILKDKIVRIPFTVDSDYFLPGMWLTEFNVVFGGNPCVRKGYPEAMESCVKAGFALHVIPNHPRGKEFMLSQLQKFSVILGLAREDGYPQFIKEAMSCGLVPILSNRNGCAELIEQGKNGFVVNIEDHNSMITQVAEILSLLQKKPKLRIKMGLEARQTILNRTWLDYSKDIYTFYYSIIKNGN